MYRQYENPHVLERDLNIAKEVYRKAVDENADEDTLVNLHETILDLEERVNFAYQDNAE